MIRIVFCRKCYYLALTNTQVSKHRKSFSNGFGANIKLSRTQLINKRKLGRFLVWFSKPLLRSWLLIIRKVLKPLAKSILILLELVSRRILNSICNHSNFVNYYFLTKFLIDTFIKTCKEQFYVMF